MLIYYGTIQKLALDYYLAAWCAIQLARLVATGPVQFI